METKKNVCGVCESVILNPVPKKKAACGTHFVHERCFRPADDVFRANKPGCQVCFSENRFRVIKSGGETLIQKKVHNVAMRIICGNNPS